MAAVCLLVSAVFAVLAAGIAHAAPVIGSASTVVRDVRGNLDRNWRTIVIDDNVFQDELIHTGESSAARLIFADRTDFMIGANSEVVLDKFIYDPNSNSGQLILRATKGLMKFRTGTMSSRSYRIDTPVATVGVRGTEFVIKIFEGVTTIQVISGEVIVIDLAGNEVIVRPDERAIIFPPGDARAQQGPLLIPASDRSYELPEEVREMVAQVVFTEETSQTELTVEGDSPPSVNVGDDQLTVNPLAGTGSGSITVRTAKTDSGKNPGGTGNTTAPPSNLVVPEDPILDNSPPPPPPQTCLMFCFNSLSDLSGWTISGGGSVAIVPDPRGGTHLIMQMTTGSPVTIAQEIGTNGLPFAISFDYMFLDHSGTLQIFLDDVLVEEILADPSADDFLTALIRVDDPDLYTRETLLFQLTFNGQISGLRLMIDNLEGQSIVNSEIPVVPSAVALGTGVALFGWMARRRQV